MSERLPTPYAVHCPKHGKVYLTEQEYNYQMRRPDILWMCPICTRRAEWDDDNYDEGYSETDDDEEAF